MIFGFSQRVPLLLVLWVTLLWAVPAQASLGGDAASVLDDALELHGVVASALLRDYSILEITTESGMRVREFLNHEQLIFAVSWSGPALPNLQRLLGSHFAEYTGTLTALNPAGLRRSARVTSSELVVESGGHLRAYAGRAYLPFLIPPGVSATDLH